MFNKFSEVLHSAADVLAPPPTNLQDFEYHWKIIKNYYLNQNVDTKLENINKTNLPKHFDQMLQLIINENNNNNNNNKKLNCMNFIITNNLLDILIDFAINDTPPGIKGLILNWLRRLLTTIDNIPFNNANISQPIYKLIQQCNGQILSPYEYEEILFLETITTLLKTTNNCNLLNFLIKKNYKKSYELSELRKSTPPINNPLFDEKIKCLDKSLKSITLLNEDDRLSVGSCSATVSASTSTSPSPKISISSINEQPDYEIICDCDLNDQFILLETILTYFESPDSKIIVRACESAYLLTTIKLLANINCLSIKNSYEKFTIILINKLINNYNNIPTSIYDINKIIDINGIYWGLMPRNDDNRLPEILENIEINHDIFVRNNLIKFLTWLDYFDCLCNNEELQEFFNYEKLFLNNFLAKLNFNLINLNNENNENFYIIFLLKLINKIKTKKLINIIDYWLINLINFRKIFNFTITINNFIVKLQLYELIIDKPLNLLLNKLIFNYINKRDYYDKEMIMKDCNGICGESISTFAPNNILNVINNFLLLLPRQLMCEDIGTCYEEYVEDASRHYQLSIEKTKDFNWPINAVFPPVNTDYMNIDGEVMQQQQHQHQQQYNNVYDIKCDDSGINLINEYDEDDYDEIINEKTKYYPGPLLDYLFNHIKNMSIHPYELNLAVIAIISKLALLPQPYLHELLLIPDLYVNKKQLTLFKAMKILSEKLLTDIPRKKDYQIKIKNTAQRLLNSTTATTIDPEDIDDIDDGDSVDETDETVNEVDEQLFESLVILEEFCKELAAITFVKYHYATEDN